MFRILGCHWRRWLGVFIDSNHFLAVGCFCCRWAHRTVRWCTEQGTVHCPVCATSARPLGFGADDRWNPLSCSCTRQSGATPDMSGATPDMSGVLWLLCSDLCHALFTTVHFRQTTVGAGYRCFVGSPDMSGAHRTVRWIIAERLPVKNPIVAYSLGAWPSAPDTVRCATW
jgi:hypothetical protein